MASSQVKAKRRDDAEITRKSRFSSNLKLFSDCHTRCEDTLQQNTINARAAIVAGSPERYAWVCERDGHLTIRSVRTGAVMKAITRAGVFPWALAEGPLQRRVWVGYSDGCIILFSSSPPHQQVMVLESGPATGGCYCLLRHLDFVFAGYGNCQVIKWDTTKIDSPNQGREGYYIGHTGGHGMAIRGLALNLNTLYTCADDMAIRKWDVATCDQLKAFKGHEASVLAVCFVAKNNRLWSCSEDRTVRVWDPDQSECLKTFHMDAPAGVMRHYGNRVWVGCWDKKVILFDSKNVEKVGVYANHNAPITDVVAVAESKLFTVWTCGADRCLKSWHVETRDNDFAEEDQDAQRQLVELQTEVEALNHLLGRQSRTRSNSCWNIDDVAYCSTQVAREFRDRIAMLEADNAQLLVAQRERREQTVIQFVEKAHLVQQNLLHRYFNTLYKHWATQAGQRSRRAMSQQELTLLGKVNRSIAAKYFEALREFSIKHKMHSTATLATERLLQQTNAGRMRLAYQSLQTFAERHAKQRTYFEIMAQITDCGRLRMYFRKLLKYSKIGKRGHRNHMVTLCMRSAHGLEARLMATCYRRLHAFSARRALLHRLRRQSALFNAATCRSLMARYYRKLSVHGAAQQKTVHSVRQAQLLGLTALTQKTERATMGRCFRALAVHVRAVHARYDADRHARSLTLEKAQIKLKETALKRRLSMVRDRHIRGICLARGRELRLRYWAKLLAYRVYKRNKLLDVKLDVLGDKYGKSKEGARGLNNEIGSLMEEVTFLKTLASEKKKMLRDVQAHYQDAMTQNAILSAQFDNLQKETDVVRAAYLKAKMQYNNRLVKLASAEEVYKLLQKTEAAVKRCSTEVAHRALSRSELQTHFSGVRECLTQVKKLQSSCMRESFTNEERLCMNVSGTIHGKHTAFSPPVVKKMDQQTPSSDPSSLLRTPASPKLLTYTRATSPTPTCPARRAPMLRHAGGYSTTKNLIQPF